MMSVYFGSVPRHELATAPTGSVLVVRVPNSTDMLRFITEGRAVKVAPNSYRVPGHYSGEPKGSVDVFQVNSDNNQIEDIIDIRRPGN